MIILDTNVVSETMRPQPDEAVVAWLDAQAADTLYLTSLTVAELLAGIAAMPDGQRKVRLAESLDDVLSQFGARVLPFDTAAARHYADLYATARKSGLGVPVPDISIAAVAAAHDFAVASRDVGPFRSAGLRVINPWAS